MIHSRAGFPRFIAALCLAMTFAGCVRPANAAGYEAYDPFPAGILRVSQPTLTWKLSPVGGARVTRVSLTINGRAVPVAYSQTDRAVLYTPAQPFAPGA